MSIHSKARGRWNSLGERRQPIHVIIIIIKVVAGPMTAFHYNYVVPIPPSAIAHRQRADKGVCPEVATHCVKTTREELYVQKYKHNPT